jgi:DNA invertase Pin-like site-specific DNA recombinase
MRAAIYARYSSDRQEDRSIEDQVALCEHYAAREGLAVVARYDDRALSGASTIGRLGLKRLMDDARAGRFDVVIAEALDRLSRDQEDLAGLHKRLAFAGIVLRTVQDGVVGDIHVGVKGLLGSLYLRDLAAKTRRGLAGVVRDGRHAGGRAFGYRAVPGAPGALEIVPAEAEIVRRIFAAYAAGKTPREIAVELNREGIRPSRGRLWAANAINGSRVRANGIINNELYRGVIVWNRQSFVKDPDTGKRVSRPNPPELWQRADAPDLRIVDEDTWTRAAARKAGAAKAHPHHSRRPKRLFSGLLRCGCCGGSYIVSGSDSRGIRIECSIRRETGACDNRRTISAAEVEERVIDGLRRHLLDGEAVRLWLDDYRAKRAANARARSKSRAAAESSLADIEARHARVLRLYEDGMLDMATAKPRLLELQRERQVAQDALAQTREEKVAELHPGAVEAYRRQIGALHRALHEGDSPARDEAISAIRQLVEKIVITPDGQPRGHYDIEVHGRLAAFLRREGEEDQSQHVGSMVAGARYSQPHMSPVMIFMIRSGDTGCRTS